MPRRHDHLGLRAGNVADGDQHLARRTSYCVARSPWPTAVGNHQPPEGGTRRYRPEGGTRRYRPEGGTRRYPPEGGTRRYRPEGGYPVLPTGGGVPGATASASADGRLVPRPFGRARRRGHPFNGDFCDAIRASPPGDGHERAAE